MKLNCKPFDMAIKVKANAGDLIPVGAVVICKEFYKDQRAWSVEHKGGEFSPRGRRWGVRDEYLRPIRDSDGEDETLAWAGKPAPIVTDRQIA